MSAPSIEDLSPGVVVEGPILPEPVEILTTVPMGTSIKLVGKGLHPGQVRDRILDAAQLAQLTLTPKDLPFDGNAQHFKLGIEAARLGLSHEYNPHFSLSNARVDPQPHQRPRLLKPDAVKETVSRGLDGKRPGSSKGGQVTSRLMSCAVLAPHVPFGRTVDSMLCTGGGA